MEVYDAFHILTEELKHSLNGHLTGNTYHLLLSSKSLFPLLQ